MTEANFYKCKHFCIYELVDRYTFEKFGEDAWMFLQQKALMSIDGIREFFSELKGKDVPVTVNNWYWAGGLQYRGLRPVYYTSGATHSQHRFGNSFDLDVKGVSAEDVRKEILANKDNELLKYITCIETNISWVHVDCRNIPSRIRIIEQ